MSYILITADFPGVASDNHVYISSNLEQKYWRKVSEQDTCINTTWYRFFPNDISEETAKNTAIRNFIDSSNLYCAPKLVLHFGINRPTFHGYPITSLSL